MVPVIGVWIRGMVVTTACGCSNPPGQAVIAGNIISIIIRETGILKNELGRFD